MKTINTFQGHFYFVMRLSSLFRKKIYTYKLHPTLNIGIICVGLFHYKVLILMSSSFSRYKALISRACLASEGVVHTFLLSAIIVMHTIFIPCCYAYHVVMLTICFVCAPQCEPLMGFGFKRGGYQCVCQPGFYYPWWHDGPFQGLEIEQSSFEEYDYSFDCLTVERK